MRKDRKTENQHNIANIQGYHEGGYYGNYAYQGFKANKYFTSDRFIKLDENFRRPDGKPLAGYGLEIETECTGVRNSSVLAEVFDKIIFSYFPADLFKMQRDGSLGGDTSAECITQVMTREFIRNNYRNFKSMYNTYFPAFGISSASSNCGMHVNISNAVFGKTVSAQDEAIKKLLYFVNHHFKFACVLFQRIGSTDYCNQMPAYKSKENCKNADLANMGGNHYICFNMAHYTEGRIELRLVGGQKNFGAFRNTMECIFWLVKACTKTSWKDMDDLVKIFSGCNQYVWDRIKSKCLPAMTITADQVREIENAIVRDELV